MTVSTRSPCGLTDFRDRYGCEVQGTALAQVRAAFAAASLWR
jgi:hypothetical protein